MAYHQLHPEDIFIYKALPSDMRDRVLKLPPMPEPVELFSTGFPRIDTQLQKEAFKSIDFSQIPERKVTDNVFINEFATLVHHYGSQDITFFAKNLQQSSPPSTEGRGIVGEITAISLRHTLKVLTGITAKEWIAKYTMLMIRDLQTRTNLQVRELAELLHFTTRQTLTQFKKNYHHL